MPDLRRAPPPRYRVVERDRRLMVIDTTRDPRSTTPADPRSPWWPRRIKFDGAALLTTHPIYDDHGPRTIQLDPASAALIGRVRLGAIVAAFLLVMLVLLAITNIWLFLPVVLFWNGTLRRTARAAVTRWLDTIAREAS